MDEEDKRTNLSKAFGTDDNFPAKSNEVTIFPPSNLDDIKPDEYNTRYVDADYEYARTNITKTIEKISDAIDDTLTLARSAQSARAFEVLATMFTVSLNANKDLLDLAQKNKDLKEQEHAAGETQVTNNTLVVTNDQLLKMLQDQGIETKTRKILGDEDTSAKE